MADSVDEVTAKIDAIRDNLGGSDVDIIGYSEGGSMAAAYTKRKEGKGVGKVITLGGVLKGTTLLGVNHLYQEPRRRSVTDQHRRRQTGWTRVQ